MGKHDGLMTMDYNSYQILNLQVILTKNIILSPNIHTKYQMTVQKTLELCFAILALHHLRRSIIGVEIR